MRCGGLYLFSGLLNEVTQVVLLNTFPISIMNHLLLIIPVQPKGGLLSYGAMGCVYTRVHGLPCLLRACELSCATFAQSTERGDRYSPCDRQRAGCLMRKWMRGDIHWLPFTHRPPISAQHSDFHLDELSGQRVVTVTTGNNVYIFRKRERKC